MSIETTPSTQPDPAWEKVIAGELVTKEAEPDDDIAPGIIEVRPAHNPAVYRAGSAAMVVAARTGRFCGLTARWFFTGAQATSVLGWRYIRAHDLQEVLGGMSKGSDWSKVEMTRRARWKTLGWAAAVTAGLNLAGWWALVKFADLAATDWSWAVMPGITALTAGTLITLYGRYRVNNPGLAPQQAIAEHDDPDSDEPFPLAWATSPGQVADCVSRALAYEGIGTRRVDILGFRGWGWEIDVELKGSTPGKVQAVADQLDTHFNLPRGGTLIEPDPAESAHLVLRLVQADPFADMSRPTVHAPNSLSVKDVVVRGRSMDGGPLELRLRGMSMLVIGKSGSAKTKGALRCLAEVITACRDAIAIEMDPVKGGLREFEGVMAAPPIRGGKDCIEWLSNLVRIASARNDVKHHLNMGDLWEPSPEHPSIFAIVDEFIYLPQPAKDLAIELLRIGRETGVYLIFAAQEGTEDSLGDAIADSVTYRVMLASRSEDIRLVFGTGSAAAGWRPDRLQPAVDDERVYDAGKCFIRGPGYDRPILWKWDRIGRDQILQAVKDRKEAGRPSFDHDSLAAAGLLHLAGKSAGLSLVDRVEALAQQGGSEGAELVAKLLRLFDSFESEFLPTQVIVDEGIAQDGAELQGALARLMPNASTARRQWEGKPQVRGWLKATVQQAASALFAPS